MTQETGKQHANRPTRHLDVKHLVCDTREQGRVRFIYVKTLKPHADILTKFLDLKTFFAKHTGAQINR